MPLFRASIEQFELANPIYVGALVSFFTVDTNGDATNTYATLYAEPTGAQTVSNPQTLDGEGKFSAPVYIQGPVIGYVTAANVPAHSTGIVDSRILIDSFGVLAPAKVATTAAITLSGLQTVDGVALVSGDRVLVKDQANPHANGLYNASSGAWSRCSDFSSLTIVRGITVVVNLGTQFAHTQWMLTSADPVVIGSSNITFILLTASPI